jgi:predicted nucleic acid-binding protein
MIAEVVLDTNVLVYAVSGTPDDAKKQAVALELLETAEIGLSGQILQEFLVTATKKIRQPLSVDDALDWIETFEEFPCIPIDSALVRQGAEVALRYQLSYWDGAILAAAHRLGANVLYTEDLNHGQLYGSVRVVNPFRPNE